MSFDMTEMDNFCPGNNQNGEAKRLGLELVFFAVVGRFFFGCCSMNNFKGIRSTSRSSQSIEWSRESFLLCVSASAEEALLDDFN
jgi:hypothetical protein